MRDCEPVRKHLRGALEESKRRQRLEIGGVADEPPISCGCAAKCRALAASPGPLKTRAASGICHEVELVRMAQKRVLARRLMDAAEAGRAAFGMTGEHNLR